MVVKGSYCIINGSLTSAAGFRDEFIVSGQSIYEVIRVVHQHPVFFDAHIERLEHSAALTGQQCPPAQALYDAIQTLIHYNSFSGGNIEIIVNNIDDWSMRFIPHHYPTDEDCRNGVKTMLYEAHRNNPNAKVKGTELRQAADKLIHQKQIYEVIYVHQQAILEGSRSNVFFINDSIFYTPPVAQVLPGITRQVVMEIIKNERYQLTEKSIQMHELLHFDAAFLTGTSPGVLPIARIDNFRFDVKNSELNVVMQRFFAKMNA